MKPVSNRFVITWIGPHHVQDSEQHQLHLRSLMRIAAPPVNSSMNPRCRDHGRCGKFLMWMRPIYLNHEHRTNARPSTSIRSIAVIMLMTIPAPPSGMQAELKTSRLWIVPVIGTCRTGRQPQCMTEPHIMVTIRAKIQTNTIMAAAELWE